MLGLDALNMAAAMLNSALNLVLDIKTTANLTVGTLFVISLCVGYVIHALGNKEP